MAVGLPDHRILNGPINFASNDETAIAYPFVTRVSNGKPLDVKEFKVPIENARMLQTPPSLDVEGCELAVWEYEGLAEGENWDVEYRAATGRWLKEHLGAAEVIAYQSTIRVRQPETVFGTYDHSKPSVAPIAHADVTTARAKERCAVAMPEFAADDSIRVGILNVWRPLKGPVVDAPLAMCDRRTYEMEDLEETMDDFGGGRFLHRNPKQRWIYWRDQMPNEVMVFRGYDSWTKMEDGGVTPHSSTLDEERQHLGRRESIEVRCYVRY